MSNLILPGSYNENLEQSPSSREPSKLQASGSAASNPDLEELEVSASRWLEDALRSERVALGENLAVQHEELIVRWKQQFVGLDATKRKCTTDVSTQCRLLGDGGTQADVQVPIQTESPCIHINHMSLSPLSPESETAVSLQYEEEWLSEFEESGGARESVLAIARRRFSRADTSLEVSMTQTSMQRFQDGLAQGNVCRRLREIVHSPQFELAFAIVILLNSFMMCAKTQYSGRITAHEQGFVGYEEKTADAWPGAETAFEVMEFLFGGLYLIEVLLKLLALQSKFFLDVWCWFDALIVAAWLFSIGVDNATLDATMFRLLRVVRLLRLARLLRAFQAFDTLHLLIGSLKASGKVLLWSIIFLGVVMTMFALFLHTILEAHIEDGSQPSQYQVFLYFGTFSRSMMSVWIVTLGNPAPIVWCLVDNVTEWFIPVFLVHHALLGFAVITVVRAIFLHETFRVSQTDKEIMIRETERNIQRNARHMLHLFEQADLDEDGIVSYGDFRRLVRDPKMSTFMSALGLEVRDAEEAFLLLDSNGNGELNINTLMDGFTRLKGSARSIDIVQMIDMIRRLETDIKDMRRCLVSPDTNKRAQGSTRESAWRPSCYSVAANSARPSVVSSGAEMLS